MKPLHCTAKIIKAALTVAVAATVMSPLKVALGAGKLEDAAVTHPSSAAAEYQGLNFSQFADLAIRKACSAEAMKNKGVDPAFAQYAWDHYLTQIDQLRSATPNSVFKLISAVLARLPKQRKGEFAKLYYQAVLQENGASTIADGPHLVLVGWGLIASGMYAQNQSFPEFAKAVAAHVRDRERFDDDVRQIQGAPVDENAYTLAVTTYLNPFWYEEMRKTVDDTACPFYRALFSDSPDAQDYSACYFFGKALGSDADRQVLRDELVKPECGCPRMGPAKVLTWAYKRLNHLDQWQAYVDQKISDSSQPLESKDRWLLVRAYVEESKPYFPNPWIGKPWIERALAQASDPTLQAECITDLTRAYLYVAKYAEGRAFLHNEEARINSVSVKQAISQSDRLLIEAQAAADAARQARSQDARRFQLLGEIAALNSRIDHAKNNGESPGVIASLERAMAEDRRQTDQLAAVARPATLPAQ